MSFTVAYIANPRDKIEQITPVNNLELRSTTAQVFNVDIGKYKKYGWLQNPVMMQMLKYGLDLPKMYTTESGMVKIGK